MDWLQTLLDNSSTPVLTAFLLGPVSYTHLQTYSGNQEYRCCMSANLSDNL